MDGHVQHDLEHVRLIEGEERVVSKVDMSSDINKEVLTFPGLYFASTGSPIAWASFLSRYSDSVAKLVNEPK